MSASPLDRVTQRLADRLRDLDDRLDDEPGLWPEYVGTVRALTAALDHVAPGRRGELLTTAQMAKRYGIAPKTLLKHKANGTIRPAMQRGKFIRWKGDEAIR